LAGSSTWQTVDYFQYPFGQQWSPMAGATSIVTDPVGNVFVGGHGYGQAHWLVKKLLVP
jgi:hypothetical protein